MPATDTTPRPPRPLPLLVTGASSFSKWLLTEHFATLVSAVRYLTSCYFWFTLLVPISMLLLTCTPHTITISSAAGYWWVKTTMLQQVITETHVNTLFISIELLARRRFLGSYLHKPFTTHAQRCPSSAASYWHKVHLVFIMKYFQYSFLQLPATDTAPWPLPLPVLCSSSFSNWLLTELLITLLSAGFYWHAFHASSQSPQQLPSEGSKH